MIGVLYSGGVDSTALLCHYLNKKYTVCPVYVKSKLPWEKTELYWAKKFLTAVRSPKLKPLITVSLSLEGAYEKNWSRTGQTPGAESDDREVFLPARNLLLITKSLLALTSRNVWTLALGTLKGNPFSDATPRYFSDVERVLGRSFQHPVKILAPFRGKSKSQVLRNNRSCPLHLSFSCINPQGHFHCGTCNKCAERQRAFQTAGLIDKTTYKNRLKS